MFFFVPLLGRSPGSSNKGSCAVSWPRPSATCSLRSALFLFALPFLSALFPRMRLVSSMRFELLQFCDAPLPRPWSFLPPARADESFQRQVNESGHFRAPFAGEASARLWGMSRPSFLEFRDFIVFFSPRQVETLGARPDTLLRALSVVAFQKDFHVV